MNPKFIALLSVCLSPMPSLSFVSDCNHTSVPPRARVVGYYDDNCLQIPPKELQTDIRVVLVSDTHNVPIEISQFPAGDLLIHAGDHTEDGAPEQLTSAAKWLSHIASQYRYGCITIGGNHDKPLDIESFSDVEMGKLFSGGHFKVLNHEATLVAGLKIFGSPYVPLTPKRQKMEPKDPLRYQGFNRDETTLTNLYASIPSDIDILITHTPAFGVLDTSLFYAGTQRATPIAVGSKALRDWWYTRTQMRPALHVFGHEHDSRGFLDNLQLGVLFCNAAAVNGDRGAGGYLLKPAFRALVVDIRLESKG